MLKRIAAFSLATVMSLSIPLFGTTRINAAEQATKPAVSVFEEAKYFKVPWKSEWARDTVTNTSTSAFSLARFAPERYDLEVPVTSFTNKDVIRVKTTVQKNSTNPQDVGLFVGIYKAGTKDLVDMFSTTKTLTTGDICTLEKEIVIPDTGNFDVRAFLWDDIQKMRPLGKLLTMQPPVKNVTIYKVRQDSDSQVDKIDQTTAKINWDSFTGATSYNIYLDDGQVPVATVNASTLTYTFQQLKPYTTYRAYVSANLPNDKVSGTSDPCYFMTLDTTENWDARMKDWEAWKFGLFIHWGGYSAFEGTITAEDNVKNFNTGKQITNFVSKTPQSDAGGFAEWIFSRSEMDPTDFKNYVNKNFSIDKYSPEGIVAMAKKAGMKYIVITSKHHEGFTIFPSNAQGAWSTKDAVRVPADRKDLLQELIDAGKAEGIDVSVYYSQSMDWAQEGGMNGKPAGYPLNPTFNSSRKNEDGSSYTTAFTDYSKLFTNPKDRLEFFRSMGVSTRNAAGNPINEANPSDLDLDKTLMNSFYKTTYSKQKDYVERICLPQIKELLDKGVSNIWWDQGSFSPENSYKIMKLITEHENGKNVKTNRRLYTPGFWADYSLSEHSIPANSTEKYLEACDTMQMNWGYNEADHAWKTSKDMIRNLIHIASIGGSYLLNVGPDKDGAIPEPMSVSLEDEIGKWMAINGEAIYATKKNPMAVKPSDDWGRVTYAPATGSSQVDTYYVNFYDWPEDGSLEYKELVTPPSSAKLLTVDENNKKKKVDLNFAFDNDLGVVFTGLPTKPPASNVIDFPDSQTVEVTDHSKDETILGGNVAENALRSESAKGHVSSVIELTYPKGKVVEVRPARIAQPNDGMIVLNPALSLIMNKVNLKVEGSADNPSFGSWNKSTEYPQWRIDVTTPGTFVWQAEYAVASTRTSLTIEVVPDETPTATPIATAPLICNKTGATDGDWSKYNLVEGIGTLNIPKGKYFVRIKHTDDSPVNLRGIKLTPMNNATKFDSISITSSSSLELPAIDATILGALDQIKFNANAGALDNWNGDTARISYLVNFKDAGEYSLYASVASAAATPVNIKATLKDLSGNAVQGPITSGELGNASWVDFQKKGICKLTVPSSGMYYLELTRSGKSVSVKSLTLSSAYTVSTSTLTDNVALNTNPINFVFKDFETSITDGVTWSSSNTSVAAITAPGVVTPKNGVEGVTTITASKGEIVATFKLHVMTRNLDTIYMTEAVDGTPPAYENAFSITGTAEFALEYNAKSTLTSAGLGYYKVSYWIKTDATGNEKEIPYNRLINNAWSGAANYKASGTKWRKIEIYHNQTELTSTDKNAIIKPINNTKNLNGAKVYFTGLRLEKIGGTGDNLFRNGELQLKSGADWTPSNYPIVQISTIQ